MEVTPANTVLHYWHFDPMFCQPIGHPKPLPFEGENSFTTLVRKYAGDIPPGAMRKELTRAGTVIEDRDRDLTVRERYFYPAAFHEDFVRNAAFALTNLGNTLVHNATLVGNENAIRQGRFERFAWTQYLTTESAIAFKSWVRVEGTSFIERADDWIGKKEVRHRDRRVENRTVGVGVYYFEEEE